MKRPLFKRIMVLCCPLVLACVVAWWIIKPTDTWRVVDAGRFSFMLPPDMWVNPTEGIDSFVAGFQNTAMVVSLDYGIFSNDLSDWPKTGSIETVTLGGEKAKIGQAPVAYRPGYHYSAAVSIPASKPILHLYVEYKRPEDYATARKIVESVRLRPNREFDLSRFPTAPWWRRWLRRLHR